MTVKTMPKQVPVDGAQMNLASTIAGTMSLLKKRNIAPKDWVKYIGDRFNGSPTDLETGDVSATIGDLLMLQILLMGTEVISSRAISNKVKFKVTPLPSRVGAAGK